MKKPKILFKSLIVLSVAIATTFVSCEDELDIEEGISEKTGVLSTINGCNFLPHSRYVDNGVSRINSTNMLHFSSIDSYYQTLDLLTIQQESHEDAFVNKYSDLSEDALNDIEERVGFDPNETLKNFENKHNFASLRNSQETIENNWLDNSDQRSFDWNNDPLSDAKIEGVEASLYNEYNEVMICNKIYKWMDDALLSIDINDKQAATALRMANTGSTAVQIVAQLGNATRPSSGISAEFYTSNQKSNNNCIYVVNRSRYYYNSNYRIKARQTMKGYAGPFKFTWKAVTISYKRKRGKWRRRRSHIAAGLTGQLHNHNNPSCNNTLAIHTRTTIKKRRRREYSYRIPRSQTVASLLGAKKNELKSWHIQRGNTDLYPFN